MQPWAVEVAQRDSALPSGTAVRCGRQCSAGYGRPPRRSHRIQSTMAQTWFAAKYEENGRFVATLAGDVLTLLAPRPGERVLDLGCGDGFLSAQIRDAGVTVVGADSSPAMIDAAISRGIDARVLDAQRLPFQNEFDAVFSNAALHWMPDQHAVLSGIRQALRPGGRFVAEFGGHGNIAAIRTALRAASAPFGIDAEAAGSNAFFTAEEYRALLEQHGFRVETIALVPRPTPLPTGLRGWIETFRQSLLDQLTPDQQQSVIAHSTDLLRPILCDHSGQWHADYVRLRFRATLNV